MLNRTEPGTHQDRPGPFGSSAQDLASLVRQLNQSLSREGQGIQIVVSTERDSPEIVEVRALDGTIRGRIPATALLDLADRLDRLDRLFERDPVDRSVGTTYSRSDPTWWRHAEGTHRMSPDRDGEAPSPGQENRTEDSAEPKIIPIESLRPNVDPEAENSVPPGDDERAQLIEQLRRELAELPEVRLEKIIEAKLRISAGYYDREEIRKKILESMLGKNPPEDEEPH